MLKELVDVPLDLHLVTGRLFPEATIDISDNRINRLFCPEENKGQVMTLQERFNVILIDLTALRCNKTSGKNDIGHRVGNFAG